jgi:hypothetical protein
MENTKIIHYFGSLVVVICLSIREVVSSSPACAGCVKPTKYKIDSDCSLSKSRAFSGHSDTTLKTEDPCHSRCVT